MSTLSWVPTGSETSPCCCCCLYPATGLGVDFTNDDLPDAVDVNGVSKTRSGSAYGDTTDGVIWESGVWAVYVAGVRTTQSCLIGGVVEDQFCQAYLLEVPEIFFGGGSATVERVSTCRWEGISEPNGTLWYLTGAPPFVAHVELGASPPYEIGDEGGPSNTPEGTYEGIVTVTCADPP